ncbi:phage tail protein I [Brevundimonas sp.]|uniref:phage tail protein I n=1 Tax=Brevundimonas sp. TaxID=1871086 RepID=UPI00286CB7E5|nr:phage tail protein I [Brevundimonas sp.]
MIDQGLLPANASPLMRAFAAENALRRDAFPAELVGQSWDPWSCGVDILDRLAWALSVDVWEGGWDELRKREAIAASPRLHSLKGTVEGIRLHLAQAGASLRQAVTPTTRLFATPVVDKATRDAWLARMPQIRIYLASETGIAKVEAFAGSARAFAGRMFASFDAGEGLYGRRAVLVDGDQVTPLRRARVDTVVRVADAVELERVFIPGGKAPALYAGRSFLGRSFMAAPVSPPRVVTFALRRTYSHQHSQLHLDTVSPGLEPMEVAHDRVAGTGKAGLMQFAGRGPARRFATPDGGAGLLYDRVLLQDGKRDGPWVRAHSFAGHARLGPKPFNATLLIDAPGRLQTRAAVARRWIAGRSVAAPHDTAKLEAALAAVRVSKAHRDRILVDGATTRSRQFGDRIPLDGSFRFGGHVSRSL